MYEIEDLLYRKVLATTNYMQQATKLWHAYCKIRKHDLIVINKKG